MITLDGYTELTLVASSLVQVLLFHSVIFQIHQTSGKNDSVRQEMKSLSASLIKVERGEIPFIKKNKR